MRWLGGGTREIRVLEKKKKKKALAEHLYSHSFGQLAENWKIVFRFWSWFDIFHDFCSHACSHCSGR